MLHTKTNSDVRKRGNHTDPAKADPRGSQAGRLPGDSPKEMPALGKNNPVIALPSPQPADRNGPVIRPNIGQMDCTSLDQLVAKAKSQIARISPRSGSPSGHRSPGCWVIGPLEVSRYGMLARRSEREPR